MNNLVIAENGKAMTNSLLVAQGFGKQHKDVLEAIRKLTAENSAVLQMFAESDYINEQGRSQPLYIMNRDGFSLLVMGFTGKRAMQFKIDFINAFNAMEAQLQAPQPAALDFSNPDTVLMLAQNWKEERQRRLESEARNRELEPKALFADAVATSDKSVLVAELAKILQQNGFNIGQNRLFEWLRKHDYLCSKGEYYNQPTQRAMEMGLFELKKTSITKPDGSVLVSTTTKVTGKGQIYFANKFL